MTMTASPRVDTRHPPAPGATRETVAAMLSFANDEEDDAPSLHSSQFAQTGDERFIPVSRNALIDRLSNPQVWPPGMADDARRFFRYLDYWRKQRHATALMGLQDAYEPFSPDSDLFVTRHYTEAERRLMLADTLSGVTTMLTQANYIIIPREKIEATLISKDSHYGLDLKVDLDTFEELIVAYRGESVARAQRRKLSRFFRKEEFTVPIFRRMVVLFKLKTPEKHIADVTAHQGFSPEKAEKLVRRARANIADEIKPDNVYIKVFKNIPKSDIEMVFPNTQVKFRMQDKVWLGITGSGALGAGVFGAAGKLALAFSNPITAAGAVGGIGMVLFRQVMNVMNQKQRYMRVLAQNLYFHSMADNGGAMTELAERAAEEDVKEEILLYSVLAKENVHRSDLREVDHAIQSYIERTFGLQVDFEVDDALQRLIADGLVHEDQAGNLIAKSPREAALHIDSMWDNILDVLPRDQPTLGREIEKSHTAPPRSQFEAL
jgi:hypothetical protein